MPQIIIIIIIQLYIYIYKSLEVFPFGPTLNILKVQLSEPKYGRKRVGLLGAFWEPHWELEKHDGNVIGNLWKHHEEHGGNIKIN